MSTAFTTPANALLAVIPGSGLLFGLLLAAAIAGGYAARALRIPRVVGYLLAGAGLKLGLYWLLDIEPDSRSEGRLLAADTPLKAIKDLGLGIILFTIGGVFEARHLRAVGGRIWRISLGESGLTFLLVFLAIAATGAAVADDLPWTTVLCFSLLLGFASIATAPAATLFVLHEYDAKGPVTDTILSLTGVNNVVCLLTFHVCFLLLAAAGYLGEVKVLHGGIWLDLLTMTVGSLVLGVVLGFLLSLAHAKLHSAETRLILVAGLIILGAGEGWLLENRDVSFNFLLTALSMGATFANLAIDPDRLRESLRNIGQPILVGFFVIAGYELHLAKLFDLRWIGGAYILCRLVGKVLGAWLGTRGSKASSEIRPYIGAAILCQAAVVIGLADFVGTYWQHPWAEQFETVVLGSVVIFEVCGAILTKWVVVRSGEVKAVTLLRRPHSPVGGSASILALTWEALLRTLGFGRVAGKPGSGPLKVRHIMRANVKCIPAKADLDEVLHFAEQSRFNHFPVVDEQDQLVGVLHFGDLRTIIYDPFLSRLMTAADLSNPNTRAVAADTSLEEALRVFGDGDVGSLPVVEAPGSTSVVGIIEQRDLLRALHKSRSQT